MKGDYFNQKSALVAIVCCLGSAGYGSAVRGLSGFTGHTLARNDDGSATVVAPFSISFLGHSYSQLYVNNNGNITFSRSMSTFTPFGLLSGGTPIVAGYFADVDTRNSSSGVVTYGTGQIDGHTAFGVEYPNVGYFSSKADKRNTFEIILIGRDDTGAGNFDIELNYEAVKWETGDASGGTNGLGGRSAVVGYSDGATTGGTFQLTGSLVPGSFLDGGANALISHSLNSGMNGRYRFTVRNGEVTPEPATMIVLGIGAIGLARRKRK